MHKSKHKRQVSAKSTCQKPLKCGFERIDLHSSKKQSTFAHRGLLPIAVVKNMYFTN